MQDIRRSERILSQVSKGGQIAESAGSVPTLRKVESVKQISLVPDHDNKSQSSLTLRSTSRSSTHQGRLKIRIPTLKSAYISTSYYTNHNTDRNHFLSQTSRDTSHIEINPPLTERSIADKTTDLPSFKQQPLSILNELKQPSPRSAISPDSETEISLLSQENSKKGSRLSIRASLPPIATKNLDLIKHRASTFAIEENLNLREHLKRNTRLLELKSGTQNQSALSHKSSQKSHFDVCNYLKTMNSNMRPLVNTHSSTKVSSAHAKRILSQLRLQLNQITKEYQRLQYRNSKINPESSKDGYLMECFSSQRDKIWKLRRSIGEILLQVPKAMEVSRSKSSIDAVLSKINDLARDSESLEAQFYCLKVAGKIAFVRKDLVKAERIFKQYKLLCETYNLLSNKATAYKNLGKCAQEKQNYRSALNYFIKMLQFAWLCNNQDHELYAYDLIGLQYFYLGDVDKSTYFHHRVVVGKIEEETSNIRQIGLARIEKRATNKKQKTKVKRDTGTEVYDGFSGAVDLTTASSDEEADLLLPLDYEEVTKKINKEKASCLSKLNLTNAKIVDFTQSTKKQISIKALFSSKANVNDGSIMENPNSVIKAISRAQSNKLSQPILLSHLSPNRALENFANLHLNHQSFATPEYDDQVDERVAFKINRVLDKFAKNLQLAGSVLTQIVDNPASNNFALKTEKSALSKAKSKTNPIISSNTPKSSSRNFCS